MDIQQTFETPHYNSDVDLMSETQNQDISHISLHCFARSYQTNSVNSQVSKIVVCAYLKCMSSWANLKLKVMSLVDL